MMPNLEEEEGYGKRFVTCDEHCHALNDPLTEEELRAAYVHWRSHEWVGGCAHGC